MLNQKFCHNEMKNEAKQTFLKKIGNVKNLLFLPGTNLLAIYLVL